MNPFLLSFFVHVSLTPVLFILVFYNPLASFFLCWFGDYRYLQPFKLLYLCIWQRPCHFLLPAIEREGKRIKTRQKGEENTKVSTREVMTDFEAGEPNWMLSFLKHFLRSPQFRFVVVQSLSRVQLFVTPWTAAYQVLYPPLPPRASSKSIESEMLFNHLSLCRPLLHIFKKAVSILAYRLYHVQHFLCTSQSFKVSKVSFYCSYYS